MSFDYYTEAVKSHISYKGHYTLNSCATISFICFAISVSSQSQNTEKTKKKGTIVAE